MNKQDDFFCIRFNVEIRKDVLQNSTLEEILEKCKRSFEASLFYDLSEKLKEWEIENEQV